MSKGDDKIEITELLMAQACKNRRFFGTIKRETDSSGTPVVRGKIMVLNGFIWSQASNRDVLGKNLDELLKMILDMGLHSDAGVTSVIAGTQYFLN